MNVKNLFKIEELLECMADNYCHVNEFIGHHDVDSLLGGIKENESANLLKKWNGSAIIIWCNDVDEREILFQKIFRVVDLKEDESFTVWFFTSLKDEPIMIIPVEF